MVMNQMDNAIYPLNNVAPIVSGNGVKKQIMHAEITCWNWILKHCYVTSGLEITTT